MGRRGPVGAPGRYASARAVASPCTTCSLSVSAPNTFAPPMTTASRSSSANRACAASNRRTLSAVGAVNVGPAKAAIGSIARALADDPDRLQAAAHRAGHVALGQVVAQLHAQGARAVVAFTRGDAEGVERRLDDVDEAREGQQVVLGDLGPRQRRVHAPRLVGDAGRREELGGRRRQHRARRDDLPPAGEPEADATGRRGQRLDPLVVADRHGRVLAQPRQQPVDDLARAARLDRVQRPLRPERGLRAGRDLLHGPRPEQRHPEAAPQGDGHVGGALGAHLRAERGDEPLVQRPPVVGQRRVLEGRAPLLGVVRAVEDARGPQARRRPPPPPPRWRPARRVEQLADRLEVGAQQHLRPDAAVDGHRRRVDLDERVLADELADPVAHEARPRPVPVVAGPVVLDRRRLAEALVVQLEDAHPALEAPSLALHRHEAAADAPRRAGGAAPDAPRGPARRP